MIKILDPMTVAAIENGQPVAKAEEFIRITHIHTCYVDEDRFVRVTLFAGYLDSCGGFVISNPGQIVVEIRDQGDKKLFTRLTTPMGDQPGRWHGDFRLADIEQLIIDNGLITGAKLERIVEQRDQLTVRKLMQWEFMRRLPIEKQAAVIRACEGDPTRVLQAHYDRIFLPREIDLDEPGLRTGIEAFVKAGALDQSDVGALLA